MTAELLHRTAFRTSRLLDFVSEKELTPVKGRAKFVQEALSRLIEEGHVDRRQDSEGKPVRHYSIRPFRAADDNRVPPFPNRVPETVSGTASPRPHPVGGRGHGRGADEHLDNGNRVPLATPEQEALIARHEATT